MPKFEGVIRSIKSQQASSRVPSRLPVTPDLLFKLKDYFQQLSADPDSFMLWAAVSTCFFGFMRVGEMTVPSETSFDPSSHLCITDVTIDYNNTPQMVN